MCVLKDALSSLFLIENYASNLRYTQNQQIAGENMSTVADRIQQRLDEIGMTPRAASIKATGADSTIRHILDGRTKSPRLDTLEKIAEVLDCSSTWLMYGTDEPPRPNVSSAPHEAPYIDQMKKDIPVLGTAAGSAIADNGFQLMAEPMDYVRRPRCTRKSKRHLRSIY